jgi:DNA repair protein RecN (Recombination protein N)
VGQKLWELTTAKAVAKDKTMGHQVLCVTHLPQLAGHGDRHISVKKQVISVPGSDGDGQRTVTRVQRLEGDDRVEELAQMMGVTSESTRESAREILEQVIKARTN